MTGDESELRGNRCKCRKSAKVWKQVMNTTELEAT
jgi:hypothetical protein